MIMRTRNIDWHPGINVTVRRGDKWLDYDGMEIDIYSEDNKLISYNALVVKTESKKLKDITNLDLRDAHDSRCKTTDGLMKVLREVYQDLNVNEEMTIVTLKLP